MISDQNDGHGKHNDCRMLSFQVICLTVFVVFVVSSGLVQNDAYSSAPEDELIELWRVHEQWETAFDNADIKAAGALWSHESDVKIIDPMGFEAVGWKKVRGHLAFALVIIEPAKLVTWDAVVSVMGDKGSVTGKYILEGAFLNQTFKATELYRKENGQWKLYYDDALGNQPPLFPQDEEAIKRLVAEVKWAYLGFDLSTLESLFDPSHRYLNSAGRSFCGREDSITALKEEQPSITLLQFDDIIIFLWQDYPNLTAEATFQLQYNAKGETRNAYGSFLFEKQGYWKLVLTNLFGHSEPQHPPWDVNCDGIVDISDLVLVGQHYCHLRSETRLLGEENPSIIRADLSAVPAQADVNGDGVVDISDLVLVGRHFGEKY